MIEYYEKCMRRTNYYSRLTRIRKIMWVAQIAKNK
ncbi:hypothetical protein UFOVP153_31 [uncultured Caudovirales phage]|uniref:Uncharacterized protein n=1 Tax=uncultured Caudovirales phage TaxID=2100421 RepID=A0A6J7W8I2_9CAUD|nr:hypothetical protein UFOVP69_27 [uncultured Caudovirales phage]CAB5170630.1 hypothetical protein UFOVP153_31 [uncultured Caudovirales phage]